MSDTRKLAFDPAANPPGSTTEAAFTCYSPEVGEHNVTNPTDAEVADLLARVLEVAGHELPEVPVKMDNPDTAWIRDQVLFYVTHWRHIEARDAANAEAEQVEAVAQEFRHIDGRPVVTDEHIGVYERLARRAYELGARAPEGEEAGR